MMNARKRSMRYSIIIGVFCLICTVFFMRLVHFQIISRDKYATMGGGSSVESIYVESVRGSICDRNGKVLVSSDTTYDFVLKYDAMPESKKELNRVLLRALEEMELNGVEAKSNLCPFEGTYPYFEFSSELTEESYMYEEYVRLIDKNYVTSSYPIEQALSELTASDVGRYYARRFDIVKESKGTDGETVYTSEFTDEEISRLVAVRYEIDRLGVGPETPFVFAQDVGYDFYIYARELSGIVPGLDSISNVKRIYHYPGYASHILGLLGRIYAEDWEYYKALGYNMNDRVGISGCEALFEEYLRGQNGVIKVYRDGEGKVARVETVKQPVAGKDVWLTIDIDVQIAAEDALKKNIEDIAASSTVTHGGEDAASGAVVATDPNNGQLLAIASYPTYDLTTYNKNYADLLARPNSPLLNRALQTTLAPGSTFKVGMAVAALETGVISRSSEYTCRGYYDRYGQTDAFKCAVHPLNGSTEETVFDALAISCNCFFYEMGHKLGIEVMNYWCNMYGFGQNTGIELGEKVGILAGKAYRESHPEFCQANGLGSWKAGDTWQAAIGQSENAFTPLQVTMYISTIINGGKRYAAHLLHSVHEWDGETVYVKDSELVSDLKISEGTLDIVKDAMVDIVNGSHATSAIRRNFRGVKYTAGGKTGTAQAGKNASDNAWFVSFAPAESPKIAVTCMIEHGFSGSNASYTARQVMDAYLN